MADQSDGRDRESTTLTYNKETKEFLFSAYPDAINIQEAIRSAISDARLVRENGVQLNEETPDQDSDTEETDSD